MSKLILRLSVLTLFCWATIAFSDEERDPTLADIVTLLERDRPFDVKTFLEGLHKRFPQMFSQFTLMRESASLQGASPEAPRVILFGNTGRSLLTYNGSAEQKNGNHIEMILADGSPVTSFDFYEISFSEMSPGKLSEKNPAKCMRCHGTDLRPIWQPYDFWPGAYGEDDDALIHVDNLRYPSSHSEETLARHRLHRDQFLSFRSQAPSHPRYRFLTFKGTELSEVAPYSENRRSGSYPPLRPNLQLTKLVTELQGQYVSHQMTTNSQCFADWAPVVAIELLNCDLDEVAKEKLQPHRDALQSVFATKADAYSWEEHLWTRFYGNQDRMFAKIGLAMLGIEVSNWSTAFPAKHYAHFEGIQYLKDHVLEGMFLHLNKIGYELPPYNEIRAEIYPSYFRSGGYGHYEGTEEGTYEGGEEGYGEEYYREIQTARVASCNSLLKVTLNEGKAQTECLEQASAPQADHAVATESMCLSCHSAEGSAPNFEREMKLGGQEWLLRAKARIESKDPAKRMPPERKLTVKERRALYEKWR